MPLDLFSGVSIELENHRNGCNLGSVQRNDRHRLCARVTHISCTKGWLVKLILWFVFLMKNLLTTYHRVLKNLLIFDSCLWRPLFKWIAKIFSVSKVRESFLIYNHNICWGRLSQSKSYLLKLLIGQPQIGQSFTAQASRPPLRGRRQNHFYTAKPHEEKTERETLGAKKRKIGKINLRRSRQKIAYKRFGPF